MLLLMFIVPAIASSPAALRQRSRPPGASMWKWFCTVQYGQSEDACFWHNEPGRKTSTTCCNRGPSRSDSCAVRSATRTVEDPFGDSRRETMASPAVLDRADSPIWDLLWPTKPGERINEALYLYSGVPCGYV